MEELELYKMYKGEPWWWGVQRDLESRI